jgi:cyclase
MSRWVLALIVLSLVAVSRDAGAQARGAGATRPVATPAADVRSRLVQGNVWLINAGFVNVAAQIGPEGVFVVDTGTEAVGEKILAEIKRLAGDKPIRYIVNTHAHADHIGGNVVIAQAGKSIIAGNFVGQAGAEAANAAKIIAHENTQLRMAGAEGGQAAAPTAAMPTDTFFAHRYDMFFNGEAIQMLYQPNAHTDGDVIVYFRKSDVVVTGDVYINTTFPVINVQQGGSLNGIIAALNRIVEITVPKDKQEGGTYVIPGHGRLADEADVVEYLDLVTIIRDRVKDAIDKRMTLEQVKAARLVRDYEGRYGATQGFWTTDAFVEAAYKSLSTPAASSSRAR